MAAGSGLRVHLTQVGRAICRQTPFRGGSLRRANDAHARLRDSVRSAIATSARSASFTDFESGKAAATSGSRSATLVRRRYSAAYLPRTPVEKSYSALISLVRRFVGAFFIVASFMVGRRAGADQAYSLSSNSMNHNQQALLAGHADDYESLFVDGIIWIGDRDR